VKPVAGKITESDFLKLWEQSPNAG
jgi:hypothetical protein